MGQAHLVVVGAGWHGIAMAKTYHEAYPDASLLVLDSGTTVGGVWAKERLYPGLRTNNVIGSYEFSDFPMIPSRYGVERGQHIHGHVVHKYLSDAVKYFDLARFLCLETKVDEATLQDNGSWLIHLTKAGTGEKSYLLTDKLVVATGLTSEPSVPSFPDQSRFRGPIMHSKELTSRASQLAAAKNVIVIGANKSAWDVCYSVASRGGHAHMCIRPSGGGPSWVWPVRLWPFKMSLSRLSSTRLFTLFDPWPFTQHGGLQQTARRFLHQSILGRWITKLFWGALGWYVRTINKYTFHRSTLDLNPWYSMYWMSNSLSIHNYDNSWFDLARHERITTHIADVSSLSEHAVMLSDGEVQNVDAIVCCTGWKPEPALKFNPPEVFQILGSPSSLQPSYAAMLEAQEMILDSRPFLRQGVSQSPVIAQSEPVVSERNQQYGPYRLHRGLIPYDPAVFRSRSLAFLGMGLSLHAILVAQVQALWITAFFNGRIGSLSNPHLDVDSIASEAITHSEYYRLRRPKRAGGHGATFPDRVFECIPYVDLLMNDLGLKAERKESWWKELVQQYTLRDYQALVQEWLKRDRESVKVES